MSPSQWPITVTTTPDAVPSSTRDRPEGFPRFRVLLIFAVFLLLIALIQRLAGAPAAAFGGFPDEPAHYVGGMVVHDYLTHAFGKNPVAFAQEYYRHRPFFALGVWPPLFYVMEAGWISVFGGQRESLLWMIAAGAAGLATLLYWMLKNEYDHWSALLGATMLLLIPAVQWSTCLIMVDLTCSLFALISILFFARFVERQRWQDSLLFGVFCGLALLTKNSTYFVLLVPPLVIAARRQWRLLCKPALWLAGTIITAMYLPWLLLSRPFLLRGIQGLELPGIWGTHRIYLLTLWHEMSFLLPLGVIGAVSLMISRRKRSGISVCMVAVVPALSAGIFVARVPVQDRLLILAYLAVIFLVVECCTAVWASRRTAIMTGCLLVFGALNWMHFRKPPANRIHNAVAFLHTADGNQPGAVLVPSGNEGPWVAEFTESEANGPLRMIVRPTKLFGEQDWNESNWKPYYTAAEEIQTELEKMPVKYCIFSNSPARRRYPHDGVLEMLVTKNAQSWQLVFTDGPELRIYRNLRWRPESEGMVYSEVTRVLAKRWR